MCDLQKSVPDVQAGSQSITTPPFMGEGGIDIPGQTTNLGLPTKTVPTKFGTFMRYALPALQGGLYGMASRQPTRALGGGGFGAGLAGGFGAEQNLMIQRGMMQRQFALQELDRQMRLAQLQNTQAYQQGRLGLGQQGVDARLRAIENQQEGTWNTMVTDQGIFEKNSKSGAIRPAMSGMGATTGQTDNSGGVAPMNAGDAQGASPATPSMTIPNAALAPTPAATPAWLGGPSPQPAAGAMPAPRSPAAQATQTGAAAPGQLTKTANKKPTPAKVNYDQGIPVSITDKDGTQYDMLDPKMPSDLQPLRDSANKAHAQHVQEQKDIQAASNTERFRSRPTTQYDTQMGIVRTVSAGEAEDHPERYRAASYQNIVDTQQKVATIKELDANLDRVDKMADAVKGSGLTPNIVAAGMADPESDLGKQFQSQFIKNLNDKQKDFIFAVRNLRQGVASYKNIMSSGGVSDARINLLERELPDETTIATGDPATIRKQLNSFRQIYTGVRNQYAPFFENMLGTKIGESQPTTGSPGTAIPPNPYRQGAKK